MTRRFYIALCLILASVSLCSAFILVVVPGATYYVAASGSDANPGTQALPWQTVAKVNSASASFGPGTTVRFNKGDRFEGLLAPTSSGAPDNPITFTSYGSGAMPVISGGVAVTTWTLYDAGSNTWRAPWAVDARPRALWVNGERCRRTERAIPTGCANNGSGFSTTASTDPGFLAGLVNPSDIELVFRQTWQEHRMCVASVSGNTVTAIQPAWDYWELWADGRSADAMTFAYHAENAFEWLIEDEEPATFYHDRAGDFLYLIPPEGVANPNSATVIAPVLEKVVNLDSLHDIHFEGVAFSHTTNEKPSEAEGFIDEQSGVCHADGDPSPYAEPRYSVELLDCERVTFLRCQPQRLGANGIGIRGESNDCKVIGNAFKLNSGTDIAIGSPEPTDALARQPRRTIIQNNLCDGGGLEFRGCPAIIGWWHRDGRIEHNEIRNRPDSGISNGWGWEFIPSTANIGNRIQYNHVSYCMQELVDSGGIYLNGRSTQLEEGSNWIHNIGAGDSGANIQGLYYDNGSSDATIRGDVLHNIEGLAVLRFNGNYGGHVLSNTTVDVNTLAETGTPTVANTYGARTVLSSGSAAIVGAALGAGLEAEFQDIDP